MHLRPNVLPPSVDQPPHPDKNRQPAGNHHGVVHRSRGRRQRVREAVDDERDDDVQTRHGVDDRAYVVAHPERPGADGRTAREQMREDGEEVRGRREENERADERVERRRRADVDRADAGEKHAARQCRIQRAVEAGAHPADALGERGCVVAAQREDGPARRNVAADCGAEDGRYSHG